VFEGSPAICSDHGEFASTTIQMDGPHITLAQLLKVARSLEPVR
jgi:hypothetical protein